MRTAVIGVGNEFRHDDGVGPEVARRVAALNLPDVAVATTDGEPARLLELWAGTDVVVIVDAVRNDPGDPGRIHELVVDRPLPGPSGSASSHGLGLGEAVELAVALGRMPRRMVVLAVEGTDFSQGVGLSPHVAAAVDRLVEDAAREAGRG